MAAIVKTGAPPRAHYKNYCPPKRSANCLLNKGNAVGWRKEGTSRRCRWALFPEDIDDDDDGKFETDRRIDDRARDLTLRSRGGIGRSLVRDQIVI